METPPNHSRATVFFVTLGVLFSIHWTFTLNQDEYLMWPDPEQGVTTLSGWHKSWRLGEKQSFQLRLASGGWRFCWIKTGEPVIDEVMLPNWIEKPNERGGTDYQ